MKMIKIIPINGKHKLFGSYHELCSYINNIERRKPLEPDSKIWSFIRRRYETLYSLYYHSPSLKDFLTAEEKEAVKNQMGLVEILKGNREHTTQLLCKNHFDMEPLKRDWCQEYCKEHGLKICELVEKK